MDQFSTDAAGEGEESTETHVKIGDKVWVDFDYSTGTATVSGTGAMWDYMDDGWDSKGDNQNPFSKIRYPYNNISIKKIIISDGITNIGNYFLYDYADDYNAVEVLLGSSVKKIGKNVVKVELDEQFGAIRVNVLKEGTSKVSFRYAGKAFTQKITVVKYEDPCKSFKIGSTNYTKYFKKSRHFNHNNRKKDITATIKIVPKKGWKLTKIEVQNMYDGTKRVKNNSKVTLSIKGTGTGLYAYFKNTKTGVVQVLNLGYGSGNFPNRNYYD